MSITLLKYIKSVGIYKVLGLKFKDISLGINYKTSEDPKKVGASKRPETSSLLVLYKNSSLQKRIYVGDHRNDELLE